jgi:hypothetical protein
MFDIAAIRGRFAGLRRPTRQAQQRVILFYNAAIFTVSSDRR